MKHERVLHPPRAFLHFIVFAGLAMTSAHSQTVHNLQEIVDSSDVIVIARVEASVQVDSGTAIVSGHTMPMVTNKASLTVCEQLKGSVPTVLTVHYPSLRPAAGWSGGLPKDYVVIDSMTPNSERLVFLKKSGDDQYQFDDLRTQSIELGEGGCNLRNGSAVEPYRKVVSALISVLDGHASTDIKRGVAMQLGLVDSEEVLPALHRLAKESQEPLLRMQAVTSILVRKDDSVLEQAAEEIVSPEYPLEAKGNLLVAIRSAVEPNRTIPVLAKALASPETQLRTSAAQALYGTNSPAAIKPLLSALEDPSTYVQFAVMQGLGNLTHEYEWRPQIVDRDATWAACLNHWREFRETYSGNSAK